MKPHQWRLSVGICVALLSTAAWADATPARTAQSLTLTQINPVTGAVDREPVFAFAQKPAVTRKGSACVITFATTAACDATVSVLDKDGKVVRRLASGVLGKNAPWPFMQDSLVQSLEWDGCDERGAQVPESRKPFSVRVSLGLDAAYDTSWDTHPRLQCPAAMACDAQGNLYTCDWREWTRAPINIRVFDRDGNYVRTLAPFPATAMDETNQSLAAFTARADGQKIPVLNRDGTIYTRVGDFTPERRQSLQVSPDGKQLVMLTHNSLWSGGNDQGFLLIMGTDGTMPAKCQTLIRHNRENWKAYLAAKSMRGIAACHQALSPDGKWLYFSSWEEGGEHVVYRMSMSTPDVPEPFLGEAGKAGADDAHLNNPYGVACDKDGNIYVSDNENCRIQVFSPEKKLLRSIPFQFPEQIAVHPRTGRIYVLRTAIRKNAGFLDVYGERVKAGHGVFALNADGSVDANTPPWLRGHGDGPVPGLFCLDASGAEPAVWVGDANGVRRYADKGKAFELTFDSTKRNAEDEAKGRLLGRHQSHVYLTVDPTREVLYVNGGKCFGDAQYSRIDVRSGAVQIRKNALMESFYSLADDTMYMRAGLNGGFIVKMSPEADGQLIPFENGTPVKWGADTKGFVYLGGNRPGGNRTFQDGICVAANGDMYVAATEPDASITNELAKFDVRWTWKGADFARKDYCLLEVYDRNGTMRHACTVPGLSHIDGVRVSRSGKLVLGTNLQPMAGKADGLPDVPRAMAGQWGSVIQLDSSLDKFPQGRMYGIWGGGQATAACVPYQIDGNKVGVEPVRWSYAGYSVTTAHRADCVCANGRFNMDFYDRVWVPVQIRSSVTALDANGNVIARIGRYGNYDSRGKDSPVADPKTGQLRPRRADDPATLAPPKELSEGVGLCHASFVAASDEALYIADAGNQRVIRAKFTYKAEETAPVP